MGETIDSWKTQVRKGYLEMCIMLVIQSHKRMYGFDLLEKLSIANLPLKEGTLYPLLNRMMTEETLSAVWETENIKGHPRKFYSLTKGGTKYLESMKSEFESMIDTFKKIQK